MQTKNNQPTIEVTKFLDGLNHPLRAEIEKLRDIIINAHQGIEENIKWNGPNYCYGNEDRITMKIHPPKQIQLIFHRGVKKIEQPKDRLINDNSGFLLWKENDRAIATFKTISEIENAKADIFKIVRDWVAVVN